MFQFQGVGSVYVHYTEWCKSHLPLEAHAKHQVTVTFVPPCNMDHEITINAILVALLVPDEHS